MIDQFYSAVFTKGVKYHSEHTGFGWKTTTTIPAAELGQPTTCKMKRPDDAEGFCFHPEADRLPVETDTSPPSRSD